MTSSRRKSASRPKVFTVKNEVKSGPEKGRMKRNYRTGRWDSDRAAMIPRDLALGLAEACL